MIAYLGLGSNLGDRLDQLRKAVEALRSSDPGLAVSPIYETAPVGGPEQGPYLNCVARFTADLAPLEVLKLAQGLEHSARRVRTVRNGPRTLDVDILLIEGVTMDTPELTVPHPRMYERAFVLAPLEDLDPNLVPAGWRQSVPGAENATTDVRKVGTL